VRQQSEVLSAAGPAHAENAPAERKRAQRFPIKTLVRYRPCGEKDWHWGTTENISSSGIIFRGERFLEPKIKIEISVAVPLAVSGEKPAEISCQGTIVRARSSVGPGDPSVLAVSISSYRITRP